MATFVDDCLREYHRRLPRDRRTGPARVGRFANARHCVPIDMYEGTPDALDLVRWKPVLSTISDEALVQVMRLFKDFIADPIGVVPSVLKEYFRACHMFRVDLTLGEDVLTLPANPTFIKYRDDDSLNKFARLIYRWSLLLRAGYYPFAELGARGGIQDRFIVAFDLDSRGGGDDAPVVSFGATTCIGSSFTPCWLATLRSGTASRALASPRFAGLRDALSAFCLSPTANRFNEFEASPYATPTAAARDDFLRGTNAIGDDLARLQAKLSYLRRCDPASAVNASELHRYRTNPRLTDADVRAFEDRHNCRLPTAYRDFLTVIGDGGPGPAYGLNSLADVHANLLEVGDGHLETPFPHGERWNPIADDPEDRGEFMAHYESPHPVAGSIVLNSLGCGMCHRLVVTGENLGEVWLDNRSNDYGLTPIIHRGPRSFLAWYEGWLDTSLRKSPLVD